MKPLGENSFWKKYNKFPFWVFIIAGLLLTVAISPRLTNGKLVFFEPLPIWEVNNPISKVFVMDEISPTTGSLAAGDSTVPNEYLVDPAIDTLFLLMETQGVNFHKTTAHPSGIVGSNNIVIIKGNFQWHSRNTTSTDRIKGVIWRVLQHPEGFTGEIIVCDNTQGNYINSADNNSDDTNQDIVNVVNTFYEKGYPVYVLDWKTIMDDVVTEYSEGDYDDGFTYDATSKISYPKFLSPSGDYYISLKYGIWSSIGENYDANRLCIINMPVLKAHGMSGATIALKNWVGVLTVTDQVARYGSYGAMHSNYFFGAYALPAKVMQVTFPKLTILDASWTNPESNWTSPESAIHTKMLLGSTDPYAVSWYAAKYILTPIAVTPNDTDPDNPSGKYYNCIVPWTNCMHDSGFAVTIDSSEISVYNFSIIPVELTSFSANVDNGVVILNWVTSTETNNFGFQVERSNDRVTFDQIAFVPGFGTTTEAKTYSYTDTALTSKENYYRLKQLDLNGSYSYSDIIKVDLNLPGEFILRQNYPNPFNSQTQITFDLYNSATVQLLIYDTNGRLVKSLIKGETRNEGSYQVKWNGTNDQGKNLSSGVYFYKLIAGTYNETKSMILQK